MRHLRDLLRRRGQSREDADALVQEAYLRLHTFLAEGKDVRHPAAFLARRLELMLRLQRVSSPGQVPTSLNVDTPTRSRRHLVSVPSGVFEEPE